MARIALCPFKNKYIQALKETYPGIEVVSGTHEEHITHDEFRQKVNNLFCQTRKSMVDIVLGRD